MKNYKFIILFIVVISLVFLSSEFSSNPETAGIVSKSSEEIISKPEKNKKKEGPELEQEYFRNWHEPYDNVLETDHLNSIWQDVKSIPNEQDLTDAPINTWSCVGPFGMTVINTNARYTGRILDIEILNSYPQFQFDFRIASASG